MPELEPLILEALAAPKYRPVKPKVLARKLGVDDSAYPAFRKALRNLLQQGRIRTGRNSVIMSGDPLGTLVGVFRAHRSGAGVVRTLPTPDRDAQEFEIADYHTMDAATGDSVRVRVLKKPTRSTLGVGEIIEIVERGTKQFVGTYFERDGEKLVRIDGTVFTRSVQVGDASTKNVKQDDKVVVEMMRFPTLNSRGEAVIVEVLGQRGEPKVDAVAVVRALGIPDTFPEAVLAEARAVAAAFTGDDLADREDFTESLVITIDPIDAKDFDDAVSLTIDPKSQHRFLTVHIADVAHFVPGGSALDREASKRGTSVYLPRQVIPMFPELISNGVASLQEGQLRYVKSVIMEWTPAGEQVSTRFAEGAIRNRKRFTYEQVSAIFDSPEGEHTRGVAPAIIEMLLQMKELALTLRKRRLKRGALEMHMPAPVLEYDEEGHVTGAHFAEDDLSHQLIEEFMLATNEAVARHFSERETAFLRRIHPAPDPLKLKAFAEFVEILGYPLRKYRDRSELQRVLRVTADKPERHAVHYAMLRSLKHAAYSAFQDEHFALATTHYCHFTSPIRRYPDLCIHRQLGRWLHGKSPAVDADQLETLAVHCSKTERRAENAEREITKIRLLHFLSERIGMELECVVTGVAEYGFYAQGEFFPAEGLVHISSLTDDYYLFDETAHTLEGKRGHRRYRLGDRVRVEVVRVDLNRRQLDFRVIPPRRKETSRSPK